MDSRARIVLVVDDDDDIRDLTVTLLQGYGFGVRSASTGEEGLEIVARDPAIDLLLTDIRMPGAMNGWELAHRAKQQRPHLRVLYMSGFANTVPWGEYGVGYGPLLPKPWRPDQLRTHIEKALHMR